MKVHSLKIAPNYFKDVKSCIKPFEIRKNDRDFKVHDVLALKEYANGEYTGEEVLRGVTYITDYEQKENYVVMAVVPA